MKKRSFRFVKPDCKQSDCGIEEHTDFIAHIQTAVLLALLERGQLKRRQFERCLEKLNQNKD